MFVAVLATLLGWPVSARAQGLPQDLQREAAGEGCTAVERFYDRPGMVLPPYVYGVFPGEREQSAAFWCQKPDAHDVTYLLVFYTYQIGIPGGCPSVVEWRWGQPGGLAVGGTEHVPLADFESISGATAAVPAGQTTAYAPVLDYYDGAERLFYCYQGEWLVRERH